MKQGELKKIAKAQGFKLGKIKKAAKCCREIRIVFRSNSNPGDIYEGTYWDKWNPNNGDFENVKEAVIVVKPVRGQKYYDTIVQELIKL